MTTPSQFPETFDLDDDDVIPVIKGMPGNPEEHKIKVSDARDALGGGGAVEVIESQGLTSSDLFSFTDIPQDFRHLRAVCHWRSNRTGNTGDVAALRFNNDTTDGNYSHEGSAAGSSVGRVARVPAGSSHAALFGSAHIEILNYSLAGFRKTWIATAMADEGSQYWGTWTGTGAIVRLDLRPLLGSSPQLFVADSRVVLYGIE